MNTRIGQAIWLALVVGSFAVVGCGKSECEKFYEQFKKCSKNFDAPKDKFVAQCEKAKKKDPEEFKRDAVCLNKGSCEEIEACREAEYEKQKVTDLIAAVAEAKSSKKYDDAVGDCRFRKELLASHPDAKQACDELLALAIVDMTATLTSKRDSGDRAYRECSELKEVAEMLGGDHVGKADTLCAEAKTSADVAEALADAKANVDKNEARIPTSCSLAISYLEKVDSEWSKAKTVEVAKACYLDLGKVIMAAKLPKMKYVCDYQVGQVYAAVKKHAFEDPDMAAHMKKANKLCEGKTE